jgi:hypothetical protein
MDGIIGTAMTEGTLRPPCPAYAPCPWSACEERTVGEMCGGREREGCCGPAGDCACGDPSGEDPSAKRTLRAEYGGPSLLLRELDMESLRAPDS